MDEEWKVVRLSIRPRNTASVERLKKNTMLRYKQSGARNSAKQSGSGGQFNVSVRDLQTDVPFVCLWPKMSPKIVSAAIITITTYI